MKKLMIAFAAVAMAACAQAASVTWAVTGVVQSADPTQVGSGYVAYLFNAADVSTSDMEKAIKGNTFSAAQASATAATSSDGKITKTNAVTGLDAGTYNYYTVLFDAASYSSAKYYIVTGTKEVKLTSATGGKAASFSNIGNTWQPIPEPTSGLLLLLGVAGLALKRKQK